MKNVNYYLGVPDDRFEAFIPLVSAAIIAAVKDSKYPAEVKAKVVLSVIKDARVLRHEEAALIGAMVEQAYNAAIKEATSKNPLSRIFKK